jgi:hypothetical protein
MLGSGGVQAILAVTLALSQTQHLPQNILKSKKKRFSKGFKKAKKVPSLIISF